MTRISPPLLIQQLSSKVISATRDLAAAAGDVAYTGVGFKPTSIICFSNIDGVIRGYSIIATDSSIGYGGIGTSTNANLYQITTRIIYCDPVDGQYQQATVKSYDTDGFTLTWTKLSTPTGTLKMSFLCFR